jgi:hypothetical protein
MVPDCMDSGADIIITRKSHNVTSYAHCLSSSFIESRGKEEQYCHAFKRKPSLSWSCKCSDLFGSRFSRSVWAFVSGCQDNMTVGLSLIIQYESIKYLISTFTAVDISHH